MQTQWHGLERSRKYMMNLAPKFLSTLKDGICQVVVDELDEAHYGGKWYPNTQIPSECWSTREHARQSSKGVMKSFACQHHISEVCHLSLRNPTGAFESDEA